MLNWINLKICENSNNSSSGLLTIIDYIFWKKFSIFQRAFYFAVIKIKWGKLSESLDKLSVIQKP